MLKNRFADDPNTYQQFLQIMMDFLKDPGSNSASEVQHKVNELFNGHSDLINGFKQFIPIETAPSKQDEPHNPGSERQQQIIKILAEYNENPTSVGELSGQLKELLGDDPAVLELLEQYAPIMSEEERKEGEKAGKAAS